MRGGEAMVGMEQAISYVIDSGAGVWAVLFVCLLAWVLKTNNDREHRYIKTIEQLSKAVGEQESIKDTLERIENHILRREVS